MLLISVVLGQNIAHSQRIHTASNYLTITNCATSIIQKTKFTILEDGFMRSRYMKEDIEEDTVHIWRLYMTRLLLAGKSQ